MSSSSCIFFSHLASIYFITVVSLHDQPRDINTLVTFKALVDSHEAYHVDRRIGTWGCFWKNRARGQYKTKRPSTEQSLYEMLARNYNV